MIDESKLEELNELKKKILKLKKNHQSEFFKIILKNNCKYTKNNNGIFVIMNKLPDNVIDEIKELISFSERDLNINYNL